MEWWIWLILVLFVIGVFYNLIPKDVQRGIGKTRNPPVTTIHSLRLVERGDEAYKRKDYGEAERLYKQALEIAKDEREETNYIYSCLTKVYKKTRPKEAYQLSRNALPTPAAFRDCAICLRALGRNAKNSGDDLGLRQTLEELYRLAVRAYLCYGSHNCQSGVSGADYDKAVEISKNLQDEEISATYEKNGRILNGGLLTERDYKLFVEVFGTNDNIYDPRLEFSGLLETQTRRGKRRSGNPAF